MAEVPATARVVVIGAGIVGNSLVHHLARLGWRDIVQIDKGALPNPGGSTGHASNFIFPVDHSREITDLTLDSVRQYQEMGVFTQSGGFELARTPERMEELRRRMSSARAWGIESELVSPDFVKEKVPFIETDQFIGAFWTPSVGVVDSLRAGTIMRESALATGALTVVPTVEVVGLDVEGGRIRRVRTSGGDIEAEHVVIACGVWSPKIGDMAGISIPLTPAVHQMITVGPCPQLAERTGEISFPIVRDMDTFCYERQHGADMEVGSYAHRAILHEPEDIPSIEQAKLSPTEMPFTADDFDPQLEQAYELMPELLGAEGAEMRYAINGLLSLTCDGNPILGESLVSGLWTAAAVWIKEGPGVGRAVAEWMTHGHSEIDVSASDIARFYPHQMRREHTRLRTTESFIKTYGIVHPAEQYESRPRQAALPDARVGEDSRCVLLRDGRLGAAALVRVQRRPARRVRRGRHAARARVGRALVVARSSTPSTSRCASAPASSTCPRSRLRRRRARSPRRRAAHRRGAVRRRRRQGDLHARARPQGRLPLRPDRDAARRAPLPRGHRRRRTAWRTSSGSPTSSPWSRAGDGDGPPR